MNTDFTDVKDFLLTLVIDIPKIPKICGFIFLNTENTELTKLSFFFVSYFPVVSEAATNLVPFVFRKNFFAIILHTYTATFVTLTGLTYYKDFKYQSNLH